MVAINRNLWERLGHGEDLLFKDLLPFMSDVPRYKRNVKRLVSSICEKSLHLFPDIEKEILPEVGSEHNRSKDPLNIYMSELRELGASDREEEAILARAMEVARLALKREMGGSARNVKVRQRQEEFYRIRSVLIARNLHLVPNFARRYRTFGVPYQDLIQEGNASLIRAADKFDWRRNVRFSTYSQWWINQAMLKALYCQSRLIRLPVYLNQKMKKIRDANMEAWGENGTDLSPEEISSNLHEPLSRIRRAMNANVGTFSIDQHSDNDEEQSFSNLLVDPQAQPIEEIPEGPPLKERISQLLASLPEKERKILVLRYGLDGNAPQTLDEVSKIFHVSRERIRQLQVQAQKKLLHSSKKNRLNVFLS